MTSSDTVLREDGGMEGQGVKKFLRSPKRFALSGEKREIFG